MTDLDKEEIKCYNLCENCGIDFINQHLPETQQIKDSELAKIKKNIISTTSELVDLFALKQSCPECGLTPDEFDKYGKFGCPHCYSHYREEFLAIAEPLQAGTQHMGKVPQSRPTLETLQEQLALLKLQFAKAKEVENYEQAASLKVEIEKLNNLLKKTT